MITACSVEVSETPAEPPREGPEGSWWLGGADGGVFVDIQDDANSNDDLYQGTVYDDSEMLGVWYQGRFKLVGALEFSPENHDHYQFWDGERLYLTEGSYLEPLDAFSAP